MGKIIVACFFLTQRVHVNTIKYPKHTPNNSNRPNPSCSYFISYKFPKCTRNFPSYSANSETDKQAAVKTVPLSKSGGGKYAAGGRQLSRRLEIQCLADDFNAGPLRFLDFTFTF